MKELKTPQKIRARNAVHAAVKIGILIRPDTCPRCDAVCKIEAHHPDHSKPLDVQWLCMSCHREEDRKQRTVCKYGHPFTAESTYIQHNGCRRCRQCQTDWQRNRYLRSKGEGL